MPPVRLSVNLTTADEDSPETHSYTVSDNRFEVVDDGNGNQQLKLKDGWIAKLRTGCFVSSPSP